MPKLSICIPSYNRPRFLKELIASVVEQCTLDHEIIISDDSSPRYNEILNTVEKYKRDNPDLNIKIFKNERTLGYDANFRSLIERSSGDYCIFMGDDDIMMPNALSKIEHVINKNTGVAVILRSWLKADRETNEVDEVFKYFSSDRLFEAGEKSAATLFRRSVAIAGYTVKRELASQLATEKFDGTLLYQVYLTATLALKHQCYYISQPIAIMRKDKNQKPTHFFGTAEVEKNKFKPGSLTYENSLHFIDGMLKLSLDVSNIQNSPVLYELILKDLYNYSYPLLSVQRNNGLINFIRYQSELRRRGFGRSILFNIYAISLLIFGLKYCSIMIKTIKNVYGRTPVIGDISTGTEVK